MLIFFAYDASLLWLYCTGDIMSVCNFVLVQLDVRVSYKLKHSVQNNMCLFVGYNAIYFPGHMCSR